jgi:hypothetical protein
MRRTTRHPRRHWARIAGRYLAHAWEHRDPFYGPAFCGIAIGGVIQAANHGAPVGEVIEAAILGPVGFVLVVFVLEPLMARPTRSLGGEA